MILCDTEIRKLCAEGVIERSDPALVNPASLDVRLGNTLLIESVEEPGFVPVSIEHCTREKPYELVPGQFVLADTIEVLNMPDNLAAQFALKSSRAREGFEHLLSGWIDPGFIDSTLTLELKNARQLQRLKVWPGMRIGQIIFMRMSKKPEVLYWQRGHYCNYRKVMPSMVEA